MGEPYVISESQEQLLLLKPYVGETPNSCADTPITQDDPQNLSQPPPKDQRQTPAAVNIADLGKCSALGFSETQSTQQNVDTEMYDEIPDYFFFDEAGAFKSRDFDSDSPQFPVKKSKLSQKVETSKGNRMVIDVDVPSQEENVVATEKGNIDDDDVFHLLKVLAAEEMENDEVEDSDISLFEVAVRAGVTFPRPRWWPDHFDQHGKDTRKY